MTGEHRIEQQEEPEDCYSVEGDQCGQLSSGKLVFKLCQTVDNHQNYEGYSGKIMIYEGYSCDEEPGQILCQISCKQEGGSSVLFAYQKPQHIESSGNTGPPDQRIPKGTDTFSDAAGTGRTGDNAGVIPDRTFDNGPFIPGGRVGMCGIEIAMIAKHILLIMQYFCEKPVNGTILKGKVGQKVNQDRKQHKEKHAEKNSAQYIGSEYPENMTVGNAIGTGVGILGCKPIFAVATE